MVKFKGKNIFVLKSRQFIFFLDHKFKKYNTFVDLQMTELLCKETDIS